MDRTLIESPIYYCLITNEKLFKSELKRLKIPQDFQSVPSGKGACTHFLNSKQGAEIALVCLMDKKHDKEQIMSLLAHEAVHIWQRIKEDMGELNPSHEFEAYSIQRISQNLFYEFKRQNKKPLKARKKTK